MKKIEAVIDPAALEAVKLHLADVGIDGRLTVTEVKGIESLGRFYELRTANQDQWKPCLKIDLIVSDRKARSAVNIILQRANLVGWGGGTGHISILPLDATLEIGAENPKSPSNDEEVSNTRGGRDAALSNRGCVFN
jgi:nitrogen regulatory protein PII